MEQLIHHLIGDYITQSDWMANNKTSKYSARSSARHCLQPAVPCCSVHRGSHSLVILGTHFVIDRFRLAKYVVWLKNFAYPWEYDEVFQGCIPDEKYDWHNCKATGYPSETPMWLAVWLMIIADNTMHLTINYLSLRYL
jgi:hypothetical protein